MNDQQDDVERRIRLAQDAFDRFYARCFWYMRPDLRVEAEHLPAIVDGLRKHGGRQGYLLADQLCR